MPKDILKVKIEKTSNINFLWGKFKDIKKLTDKIMKEINEAEENWESINMENVEFVK